VTSEPSAPYIEKKKIEREREFAPETRTPARAHTIPENFQPNEEHQAQALGAGLNLNNELAAFIDYYTANGKKYARWDYAFKIWLRKAVKYPTPELPKKAPTRTDEAHLQEALTAAGVSDDALWPGAAPKFVRECLASGWTFDAAVSVAVGKFKDFSL
jgi:hypothetical protein